MGEESFYIYMHEILITEVIKFLTSFNTLLRKSF